jgi:XTP/dITP diphosphohydrolase
MNQPCNFVLASANPKKIEELQQLLSGLGINVVPQGELNIEDIEETGLTFVENAILKARHASERSGLPAIADDSGLEVDYLHGAPGIYSARFAGKEATDEQNIEKLLFSLKDAPLEQRKARYQSIIVFMSHSLDPTPIICRGVWEGRIALERRGTKGFGYDPIFHVDETDCHASELDEQTKNRVSHRGKAIAELLQQLNLH